MPLLLLISADGLGDACRTTLRTKRDYRCNHVTCEQIHIILPFLTLHGSLSLPPSLSLSLSLSLQGLTKRNPQPYTRLERSLLCTSMLLSATPTVGGVLPRYYWCTNLHMLYTCMLAGLLSLKKVVNHP